MAHPLAMRTVLSTNDIRQHFPALERMHGRLRVAYFDGPGGTQVPRAVVDAVTDYLLHHNANTHWAYPTSAETDAALDRARRTFGAFLNCEAADVMFGANMTTLTYHLARALARSWNAGDEVVVTELDHHANVAPWTALEQECGITIRTVPLNVETGQIEWTGLEQALSDKTRLLAIGAASNALGTITDVKAAADRARSVGALVFIDGVHYAPHALPDVAALHCDFFTCSAYKCYGTHVGVMSAPSDLLASIDFPRLLPASDEPPERGETGTLNHEGIVGAAAAVEWLGTLSTLGGDLRSRLADVYATLHARGRDVTDGLWRGLSEIKGVTVYGPPPAAPRTPTIAFTVTDVASSEVARRLSDDGVFVSHGDFYAKTVVDRLGLRPEGLVRAGCACYTTQEEVARLVDAVDVISRVEP